MNNTDRLCMGCMNDNGGEAICPICGYDASTPADENCLAPGTWIKERYLVGRVFEKSGEGVTYIGWDNLNNNVVYIKEYFPQGVCSRAENKEVIIDEGKEYIFNNGIMQFLDISKKLADVTPNPCLMPVVETLEMNGSAYSVIKAAAGIPLREFLLRNGGTLRWEQAKPLFLPLISAIGALHKAGIYHLGISPETIIVGRDGKLHLFGISIPEIRRAGSDFTSQIFPGFAAVEQYSDEYEIGAHTDVYALAATLFRVLIGNPPMAANERIVQDNTSIPAKMAEEIPPYVLSALANALQITPERRTSSMVSLRGALSPQTGEIVSQGSGDSQQKAPAHKKSSRTYALIAALITVVIIVGVACLLIFTVFRDRFFGEPENSSTPSFDAPEISSHGQVDSNINSRPEYTIDVPSFEKMKYSEIVGDVKYNQNFKFKITDIQFHDTIPEGAVVSQTVGAGEKVKPDTEIGLVISSGPAEIVMPDLKGKTPDEARFKLLELGFSADSIQIIEKHDEDEQPQVIISSEIKPGEKVSRFSVVVLFFNTYEEPAEKYDTYSSTGSQSSN